MQHIIFYSWQADLPNNTNRGFIQSALDEAARSLATDLNIEPVIERDTKNVPGSPDIASTIFKKIAKSDVFVADITLINPKSAKRRTPNPNVLLELGYALHALGDDRTILIINREYGLPEALPFDLKMRRVIPYNMTENAPERAPERKRLASILANAIKDALATNTTRQPNEPTITIHQASIRWRDEKAITMNSSRRSLDGFRRTPQRSEYSLGQYLMASSTLLIAPHETPLTILRRGSTITLPDHAITLPIKLEPENAETLHLTTPQVITLRAKEPQASNPFERPAPTLNAVLTVALAERAPISAELLLTWNQKDQAYDWKE
ncbi:MAG: hypothetical protein ACSLE8_21150 [Rhodococcus sp. (in: high G+C Gram-positive bacteria)]